jgi:hypothetical protein
MDAAGARALQDRLAKAGSTAPLRDRIVAPPDREGREADPPIYSWLSALPAVESDEPLE